MDKTIMTDFTEFNVTCVALYFIWETIFNAFYLSTGIHIGLIHALAKNKDKIMRSEELLECYQPLIII